VTNKLTELLMEISAPKRSEEMDEVEACGDFPDVAIRMQDRTIAVSPLAAECPEGLPFSQGQRATLRPISA
jgi:hypothetical protein